MSIDLKEECDSFYEYKSLTEEMADLKRLRLSSNEMDRLKKAYIRVNLFNKNLTEQEIDNNVKADIAKLMYQKVRWGDKDYLDIYLENHPDALDLDKEDFNSNEEE